MSTAILKDTSTPWGDTPKVVDRSFEENLIAERDAAIAKVNAHTERQRQHQVKLGQLTKAVTTAEAALVEFEAKKSFFTERKALLKSQLTELWQKQKGDLSTQLNFDPLLGVVESHGTILAIDAALADAPRVRKHLDHQLHVAKQTLADFSK
jgi:hypothetical protein